MKSDLRKIDTHRNTRSPRRSKTLVFSTSLPWLSLRRTKTRNDLIHREEREKWIDCFVEIGWFALIRVWHPQKMRWSYSSISPGVLYRAVSRMEWDMGTCHRRWRGPIRSRRMVWPSNGSSSCVGMISAVGCRVVRVSWSWPSVFLSYDHFRTLHVVGFRWGFEPSFTGFKSF